MRARDTTEKAAAVHAALNRAMGPERRFWHPEYTEAEVVRELIRQLYGDLPQRK